MISEQSRFGGMISRALIVITLLVGSLMLPGSIAADTWLEVSVVIRGGYEYSNVRVDYDPALPARGLLITRDDGSTAKISVHYVFMIVDKNGTKITELVLKSTNLEVDPVYQPEDKGTDASEVKEMIDSRVMTKKGGSSIGIHGSQFKLAISGGVGFGEATGGWFEGLTNGKALNGAMRVMVHENYYMGFNFRRQELGVGRDLLGIIEPYDIEIIDMKVHLKEYCFFVGQVTDPATAKSPFGFVEMGFGGITHVFDITMTDGISTVNDDSSETKFAMYLAVGVVVPFHRNIGVMVEGTMRYTGSRGETINGVQYEGSSGIIYGIHAGIVVLIR